MTFSFRRHHRWLGVAGIAVAALLLLLSSLPALGQPLAPAPAPSLSSSDESVRNALREAPLPAQAPSSSSSPAIPTPAPLPSANASVAENADDEKHVAIVHDAAALHDAMLDPAAAIIELGTRSKNGVVVRLRMGRETGEREREKDFFPLNAFQRKKLRNVLPAFPFPHQNLNLETKQ